MDSHVFFIILLHKFLTYFHVFISKKLSFLNCILVATPFVSILPCFHLEHVFREKKILKNKIVANWTKEEKMKKMFVETIQHLHVVHLKGEILVFLMTWSTMWVGLLDMEVEENTL